MTVLGGGVSALTYEVIVTYCVIDRVAYSGCTNMFCIIVVLQKTPSEYKERKKIPAALHKQSAWM